MGYWRPYLITDRTKINNKSSKCRPKRKAGRRGREKRGRSQERPQLLSMESQLKKCLKKSGKKGKGKKGKKSGKTPTVIDGIPTEEMSKEQLEEHIQRLREELEREREERNYFQLERDKVNTFWEITKRQLEEKKAELRNKDREMEDAEERHQIEIKVYKQKVKHLLYEHQNNISELKAEGSVALKQAQDGH